MDDLERDRSMLWLVVYTQRSSFIMAWQNAKYQSSLPSFVSADNAADAETYSRPTLSQIKSLKIRESASFMLFETDGQGIFMALKLWKGQSGCTFGGKRICNLTGSQDCSFPCGEKGGETNCE